MKSLSGDLVVCCVKVAVNNILFPVYMWSSMTLISELLQRNMLIQRCGVFSITQCLTWFTFWSTEEEEEEEIAQPQPVNETQTEKPDQKEEEEGTTSCVLFNILFFDLSFHKMHTAPNPSQSDLHARKCNYYKCCKIQHNKTQCKCLWCFSDDW